MTRCPSCGGEMTTAGYAHRPGCLDWAGPSEAQRFQATLEQTPNPWTLRDLFAAAALAGHLAGQGSPRTGRPDPVAAAIYAYVIADAMVWAREPA